MSKTVSTIQTQDDVNKLYLAIIGCFPNSLGATPRWNNDRKVVTGFEAFNNVSVFFNRDSWNNKISVSGYSWPTSELEPGVRYNSIIPRDVGAASPSIKVSESRTPDAIAADILRRFLPEYTRVLALCVARRDANDAIKVRTNALVRALAAAQGTPVRTNFKGELAVDNWEVGDDNATVRFYLPAHQAIKLAAFIKTL